MMMRAIWAAAALAATASAQGVSSAIEPSSSPPPGCSEDYNGAFQIGTVNVSSSSKRSLEIRQESHSDLGITLQGGILKDQEGRTGYIASNQQFQFDDPPQAGAIYTAGFSVCPNGRLAIGNDQTWYRCLSGPGTTNSGFFYNIYLENELGAGQCIESYILAVPVSSGDGPGSPGSGSGTTITTTSSTMSSASTTAANTTVVMTTTTSASMNGTAPIRPTTTGSSSSSSGMTMSTTGQTTTTTSGQPTGQGASATGSASASPAPTGGAPETLASRRELFGLAAGLLVVIAFF